MKRAIDTTGVASGGTNIGAGVSIANTMLINNQAAGRARVVILLTDGQGSYNAALTSQAKENNIVIYTIGLGTGVDATLLGQIANGTGGRYLQLNSATDLPAVYRELNKAVLDDGTDTDGDGVSDCEESYGVLASAGFYMPLVGLDKDRYIVTDPNNPDTDSDGLTDGAELGGRLDLRTNPFLAAEYKFLIDAGITYFYNMGSDPRRPDTDNDTLGDKPERDGIRGADNKTYRTSALRADTDGDGITDPIELQLGTNPLKPDRPRVCGSSGCTFDRAGTVAYAKRYAATPRQDTPFHPFDNDCTGFVSQTWHFGGGLPMAYASGSDPGWAVRAGFYFPAPDGWVDEGRLPFGKAPRSWSKSWGLASEFPQYWGRTGTVELIPLSYEDMLNNYVPGLPGDIIGYEGNITDTANAGWDHVALLGGASRARQRHVVYEHSGVQDPELGNDSQPRRWNNAFWNERDVNKRKLKRAVVVHYKDAPSPDKANQSPAYHESFGTVD